MRSQGVAGRVWRGFKRTAADWRWWAALAFVGLVGCVGVAMLVLLEDRADARFEATRLRTELEGRDAVDDCRSIVAANLAAATADYLLVTGERLTDGDTDDELVRWRVRFDDLRRAIDARLGFEANPNDDCPAVP